MRHEMLRNDRLCEGAAMGAAKRPAFGAILAMLLVVMLVTSTGPAFAAGASDTPDSSSRTIQEAAGASGSTGTVVLGKILTTARANDFPAVSDFVFTIEACKGWDNANESTARSGAEIAAAQMPMPATSDTAHQVVTVDGSKATVFVGNFLDSTATNHSTGDGDDSATRRTRTTPVNITFSKAGYYVYKVKEVGSIPNNTAANAATNPVKNVPGVDYDDNEYFMVFYVCNKVDEAGNTINGVYVHSITSFANESGSETYQPNLSDIQNVTDNGGEDAGENTGAVNADGTVTHNLGKVGVSSAQTPNRLEAFRMWNGYVTRDVVLKKNVTGNLGDKSKEFEFTVTLTGLAASGVYTTNVAAVDTGDTGTVEIVSASAGTKVSGTSYQATEEGTATLLVKLKDDDRFVLNALPLTAQYAIQEAASDHVAKYAVASSNTATGAQAAVIAQATNTNGTTSNKALSTETETVDRYDGTVTVTFTNNRDLATITGVPGMDWMLPAALALVMAGLALALRRSRRSIGEVDVLLARVEGRD